MDKTERRKRKRDVFVGFIAENSFVTANEMYWRCTYLLFLKMESFIAFMCVVYLFTFI